MSTLAFIILHISVNQSTSSPNLIFIAVGVLLIALGNYFKVIQPNYFIGIKTPWTLRIKKFGINPYTGWETWLLAAVNCIGKFDYR
jgi:uncharacterized membrane protein